MVEINYKLADGSFAVLVVEDDVAQLLKEEERLTANADRRERYHTPYSIDALDFEGLEYACLETPETVYIQKEDAQRIENIMSMLSETQRRRILMRADGMTIREIAKAEGTSVNAVKCSLDSVRKIFEKYL